MATLALAAAGSALGGALLPGGISLLGASLTGAAIGQAAGALAGRYVDQALFGSSGQSRQVEGARLSDLQIISSTEGAVVPRLYGRARMAGQIIWATALEEEIVTTKQSGGGGKGRGPSVSSTQYNYYANFAVGLCEGEISRIGTIWADGKPLALKDITYRIYKGSEAQQVDSLISSKEGADNAPAYRGLAYIVFEHLALADFGNRIPQLNFEVFRAVDSFEQKITAVTMLPGSGEFVYHQEGILREDGYGQTIAENIHTNTGHSDWTASLDDLEQSLPNAKAVSLIVSWFGSDLRAGHCTIQPQIDNEDKITTPHSWSVAGLFRQQASLVSSHDGEAAYGGTPSDQGVMDAIKDLKDRGLNCVFNPFILMDIPTANTLPDPYGGAQQGAYPWRGLITSALASIQPNSTDKTAFVRAEIDRFMGNVAVSDFQIVGDEVHYNGVQEWSYRRMILHYAHLCKLAGGVHAFLLGSELRGLTTLRDDNNAFPFVEALIALAQDVRSILGDEVKITYGADWSEYFGYHPQDGSNDVWFHLDPLWASSAIDIIGIDCYWPLSDWREGTSHLDDTNGSHSIYDLAYLKGNIAGGEGFEYYYGSSEDRDQQVRTPITDGLGKAWVFRYKDIKGWWQNLHYNRVGGIEQATPTAWIPESKPFWLTEIGCGAVDKGANQPNIFHDSKSVQSGLPYYSSGKRDDFMQRRYLQAFYSFFDREDEDYISGSNPLSSFNGLAMVDQNHIFAYSWDARPYPAFPLDRQSWGDGENWQTGHWLNGRVGDAPLEETVQAICADYQVPQIQTNALEGVMSGLVVNSLQNVRSVLQPLELAFFFDSYESGKNIVFRHRKADEAVKTLRTEALVESKANAELFQITRAQETDLPAVARVSYIDNGYQYQQATLESRRIAGGSAHVASANLPLILHQGQAQAIAQNWLNESWGAREKMSFSLPPSMMTLEPTDKIVFDDDNQQRVLRITELTDQHSLEIVGQSLEASVFETAESSVRPETWTPPIIFGKAQSYFMDLPLLAEEDNPAAGYCVAYQEPWPQQLAYYRSPESNGYQIDSFLTAPATMGTTLVDLKTGYAHRRDFSSILEVALFAGQLSSISDLALLSGGNSAALRHEGAGRNGADAWEIIQFQNVELIGVGQYRLSTLLRGQRGTEHLAKLGLNAQSIFVLLDEAVGQTGLSIEQRGLPLHWKFGPASTSLASPSFSHQLYSHEALALRPFSPVHGRLKRVPEGIFLSWVRRSRIGGDSWEGAEIIIGEDVEAYEVDILKNSDVVRTLTSEDSHVLYTQTDFDSDFDNPKPASLNISISQMSTVYGRGYPLEIELLLV